jgi:hypothetical protein
MRHSAAIWIGTILFAAALGGEVRGQQFTRTGRETLKDLPGVEVLVEPLQPELKQLGLTEAAIQADAERRLRTAGITIYASQTANPSPAKPYLYIHLNALKLARGEDFVVAVQVHVRQTVRSVVTGSQIVDAMTWDSHNIVAGAGARPAGVREEIGRSIERFTRDWAAVH